MKKTGWNVLLLMICTRLFSPETPRQGMKASEIIPTTIVKTKGKHMRETRKMNLTKRYVLL